MSSSARRVAVPQLDARVGFWLLTLATLAVINVGLWLQVARAGLPWTPYSQTQLLLSGVFIAVCGFRALFPRVDLERLCVWDSWLSAVLLGRTAATIAELCFGLQCALCVGRLAELAAMPALDALAAAFVPLVLVAEVCCWYAVLALDPRGHAVEESLWALLMAMMAAALGAAWYQAEGPLRTVLTAGTIVFVCAAVVTALFDVPMYVRRGRRQPAGPRLSLADGLQDCVGRRHPTGAWEAWRSEVPWMTVYFSVGAWMSLSMVLLEGVASSQ